MPNAMTYSDIRDIMVEKGLASDPSFQKVNFAIVDKQLPCLEEGCPLGLYFPEKEYIKELGLVPERTIVIPYDCSEGVLLHELGHHWGNWYQHNLTEKFAEDFRIKYGGAVAMLACGKMACACGTCRLETGWSCIPRMSAPSLLASATIGLNPPSLPQFSVADLPSWVDLCFFTGFSLSFDGGQTWSYFTQEVLVGQPFQLRVGAYISPHGGSIKINLKYFATILLNGQEAWNTNQVFPGIDVPPTPSFIYDFPYGLQVGQWGIKVDMYAQLA